MIQFYSIDKHSYKHMHTYTYLGKPKYNSYTNCVSLSLYFIFNPLSLHIFLSIYIYLSVCVRGCTFYEVEQT